MKKKQTKSQRKPAEKEADRMVEVREAFADELDATCQRLAESLPFSEGKSNVATYMMLRSYVEGIREAMMKDEEVGPLLRSAESLVWAL